MEILDLYDNQGKLLGKTIERGNKNLAENENIKLTIVWIKCKNKYLIQLTSKQKGSVFASTGGHVQSGKTSLEQAILELEEELNLHTKAENFKFLGNIFEKNAIFDVFLIEDDSLDKYDFKLQEEEVEDVYWLDKSEIEKLIEQNKVRISTAKQYDMFIKNKN